MSSSPPLEQTLSYIGLVEVVRTQSGKRNEAQSVFITMRSCVCDASASPIAIYAFENDQHLSLNCLSVWHSRLCVWTKVCWLRVDAAWRKYTKFWRWANTPRRLKETNFSPASDKHQIQFYLFYLLELWNNRGCDVCFSAAASNNNHFIAECAFCQTCLKWKKTSRWLSFRKNSPGNSFETLSSSLLL